MYMYIVCTGRECSVSIPDRRQSKTFLHVTTDERGSKIARDFVFDCHLSPVGRQMSIENPVSNDFYLEGNYKKSCLEKCWKSLKSLEKSLNSTIFCRT